MSDLKLFKSKNGVITEVPGQAAQIEKSLQTLFEANLEALLGVRFLATEHSTGAVHGGRIDTLGIDEDGSPVIIEYKRAINENVVSQGLFYLDWLLDHRKEFQWLVMERLGAEPAKSVEWSGPRLICVAGDFTRYDQHAVKQINRNIELLRYRRFSDDLLLLELVHAPKASRTISSPASDVATPDATAKVAGDPYQSSRIGYRIAQAKPPLRDLFEAIRAFLIGLGDDVREKELQNYVAFKRIKNFACVELWPKANTVGLYLKLDPQTVALEEGFTRNVRSIGHFGTGDLEVTLSNLDDFAKAQPLLMRAYEGG